MRNLLIAVAVASLALFVTRAIAEETKAEGATKVTGVLIDQMCAEKCAAKDDAQAAAEKHEKSCALKCADKGFAIMSEGKVTKLSADSSDKVKDYLSKEDSKTTATIEGTKGADGTITVTSISPAEAK